MHKSPPRSIQLACANGIFISIIPDDNAYYVNFVYYRADVQLILLTRYLRVTMKLAVLMRTHEKR
jgi:hypothetical protein